jgi:hypothetical protein
MNLYNIVHGKYHTGEDPISDQIKQVFSAHIYIYECAVNWFLASLIGNALVRGKTYY